MGIRRYGPGKFSTILDSYVYEVGLDGVDEEASYGEGEGWYGLIRFDRDVREYIRKLAKDADDKLTGSEEDEIDEVEAVIIYERGDGIVAVDWYADKDDAQEQWEEIEKDTEGEE